MTSNAAAEPAGATLSPAAAGIKPQTRIDSIDGLRALAMFMVFTFHVWEFGDSPALTAHVAGRGVSLGAFFGSLPSGVDLFMVLSGFCLFWPLAKTPARLQTWSVKDYFRRRFRRIAPPYYAAILFVSLLPNVLVVLYRLAGRSGNWQSLPTFSDYITHFLFIHTLFLGKWNTIEGALWSLGLEMQFYVAFPLVVWCYRRYGLRTMAGMILISVIYRTAAAWITKGAHGDLPYLVTIFFLGKWMQFAAGMLAAWYVARRLSRGRQLSGAAGSCMLAAGVALYFLGISALPRQAPISLFPVTDILFAAGYGMAIVALCSSLTPVRALFENRAATWLGYISYTVFLIHQNTVYYVGEFFKKVHPVSGPMRFLILETVGFGLILAISVIFFKYFEAPFVNDPRKRVQPQVT